MKKKASSFSLRKKNHIALSLDLENQAVGGSGFQFIQLEHRSLPEIDFSEVDISTSFFKKKLKTPFIVTGMTGGWTGSFNINKCIAQVCAQRGWMMGVGSQRRQIFDPDSAKEWNKIREAFPDLVLMGNIGLSQLIQMSVSDVEKLVSSLSADAMVVHTNPLQEALQPEGTPQFKGGLKALKNLCDKLSVPVILKETGCGFSKSQLETLISIGLFAVDISGYGGTHWGRIEGKRTSPKSKMYGVSECFQDWGISTVDSIIYAKEIKVDYEVWASGGIRSGCDSAKGLALGAHRIGIAKLVIEEALKGKKALDTLMCRLEQELKIALFCCGCKNVTEVREKKLWKKR